MGKKSKPPPPPDYAALEAQRAANAKTQAAEQTAANRPNQITPFGTTKWSQDPSGQWTENVSLDPADQKALENQRAFDLQRQGIATGALGRAGAAMETPLSAAGLPEAKGIDESKLGAWGDVAGLDAGFGAVEGVRDAMMGRMAPQRSQQREAEIQRLKNQGLTEDSEAFQRGMKRLDEGDTDAQQQALLKAMGAYGDIFNRGLSKAGAMTGQRGEQVGEQERASNLASMLRGRGLAERETVRQSPINDFLKLTGGTAPTSNPDMPGFMAATGYDPANPYGAAKDAYGATVSNVNAANANRANTTSGLMKLGGTALMVF